MGEQVVLTLAQLTARELADAFVWCLPRFRESADVTLGLPLVDALADVPGRAASLVVIGGGTMIDEAKLWRRRERPDLELIAVPTLWGSGAEASGIVALNRAGGKLIEVDEALRPDARVLWPELAAELPGERARHACGDAWSHALEGFLSPLADDGLRAEIAVIVETMLGLPLANDPAWFEPSARACAAQARASVGLVHGIAHVLEGALAGRGTQGFGHARLCSLYLSPVLALNRELSPKFDDLTAQHGVDGVAVLRVAADLFDAAGYRETLPALEERWRDVLRDPCSRTNSALVRPKHLEFFTGFAA
jgi:alcohol dehydrogenase class IV